MGFESSESAVALVGMDGFRLLAALEVDGELHQLVAARRRGRAEMNLLKDAGYAVDELPAIVVVDQLAQLLDDAA